MAKLFKLLLAAVAASLAVACSTQELDGVNERLNDLESRVSALEKLCKEMNSNISSLQGIVTAMQSGDYITSVTPITSGDKTIGYTITFAKGQPITIYHGEDGADGKDGANGKDGKDGKDGANGQDGKDGADGHTPVIGVKQDTDGIWYWTLDGQWLLDDNGQKFKAVGIDGKDGADGKDGQNGKDGENGKDGQDGTPGKDGENGKDGQDGADGKDGITPQLKIEDGYWYISYDNGVTWTKLDKAVGADGKDGKDGKDGAIGLTGDSMFTSIDTSDPDYVVFTLLDGTTIKIPTWYAFEQLRTMVNQMNSNIEALQTIVYALQNNDYISSILPIVENGKEVGYVINFTKSGSVTIYHGKDGANGADGKDGKDGTNGQDGADGHTPVIGVKQDTDGIWYWTLDGQWLLDDNGQKVKAVGVDGKDGKDGKDGSSSQDGTDGQDGENGKDGITPQLKIEDGYWYVSMDNGVTWTQLGKATGADGKDGVDGVNGQDGKDGVDGKDGDSMFQSVTVTDTEVTFVTSDGQTFVVKRAAALSIEFDSADLVVMSTNATRDIHYTITSGVDNITIEALSSADIKVKVNKADAKTGTLTVKTGATIDEYSKVVVLVNNGSQAIMRTLNFEEEAIEVEENTTKEVSDEGGEVTLEFFSNVHCHAVIPEEAQSWISIAPETKGMEKQNIELIVQPNMGLNRSATINVIGDDDASNIVLSYTITQEVGGVWKEGTIPPDNEIWYATSDNVILDLEGASSNNSKPFDVNVISHTYTNGKGIIVCDGPIKRINDHVFCYSLSFGSRYITNLFLPNSVEELGTGALQNIGIRELMLPDNLRFVGSYALNNPTLERFYGKNTSEDGRCVIIEDGYMPDFGDTRTPVHNYMAAFAPAGITEYTIPSEVEILGFYALAWCPNLKVIHFNEGLKQILADCFAGDTLDCSIILPTSLQNIIAPFHDCNGIKGFYGNELFHTSDGHCLLQERTTITKFVGDDVINYTIPDGITDIVSYAFDNLPSLESVTFANSLTWVGPDAFRNCPKLKALYGDKASSDHRGFINGTEYVSFLIRYGVTDYTIPSGIKSFGWCSFANSPDLVTITLTDEVIELGGYDFAWCDKLKKVVLSSSLTNVRGQNPFLGSSNLEEVYFRSYLPPTYSDTQFYESDCSHLTVYVPEETLSLYKSSGWYQYAPYMVGYKYDDIGEWNPDYYLSSDYSSDGAVTTLQQSSTGNGLDLVFMGDAFSDRQIADGTYANVMQKAADAFFSEEPYKSMKDRFNVYTVNVVSATEGYEHSGQALSTGHGDGTYVYGNDAKVIEYAKNAIGEERMDDAVIIVMMNEDAYAGTCFMYYPDSGDYGRGLSIAYFPTSSDTDTFNGLVSHEAGGHGFAKLADEYAYESMGAISADAISGIKAQEPYGWWKNVDFTSDPATVKWSQFLSDPRYANEGLGCFEGGLTYWTGVWRPTDASIMRYNTGGFNAPSRYAIWYRIGKLAYGESWEGSYEDFVAYDAVNRTPAAVQRRSAQRRNYVERPLPQLPPPVVVGHSWREELQKK